MSDGRMNLLLFTKVVRHLLLVDGYLDSFGIIHTHTEA
jgi:hypothetical protein